MSQFQKRIFVAVAAALSFGAVQLAFGHDLAAGLQASFQDTSGTPASAINRAAKADRAPSPAGPSTPTHTISLRPDGLSDTLILIRIPVAEARNPSAARPVPWTKPGQLKLTVACEPMVSVLTEVARRLQPGRCVT
jgi:hypothetical protein